MSRNLFAAGRKRIAPNARAAATRVRPGADIAGASFYSFLTYSAAWDDLTDAEKAALKDTLPFQRTGGFEPGVNGYLQDDRTYAAGGRALIRASVRSY